MGRRVPASYFLFPTLYLYMEEAISNKILIVIKKLMIFLYWR